MSVSFISSCPCASHPSRTPCQHVKKTNTGGGENQKGREEKRIEADGDVDMAGGDSTETSTDRERKGDWRHLFAGRTLLSVAV